MKCSMRNEDHQDVEEELPHQEEEFPHQGCEEELPRSSDTNLTKLTLTR